MRAGSTLIRSGASQTPRSPRRPARHIRTPDSIRFPTLVLRDDLRRVREFPHVGARSHSHVLDEQLSDPPAARPLVRRRRPPLLPPAPKPPRALEGRKLAQQAGDLVFGVVVD